MKKLNTHDGARPARWLAAVLLAAASCGALAQSAIEAVTGALQNGSEVIRIDLTQAPAALPSGVSIQSPARIALDFPGVSSTLPRTPIVFNQGNLRSASVLQVGDRSRVVLNLKQATSYKAELQGNSVLIVLEPAAVAMPSTPAPSSGLAAPMSASTCASRAKRWWSSSSTHHCPKACAVGST
jgi:type IV pilus assembly protein PilQ